uniref:PBP domain-containing protein n=1 Tax=Compsopogon caeruleus TaxID=31354 RepID=A0A7S1TG25_9RHOD|mmetsp:Transcript_5613/g.11258  ORF Transcript_5613/g.11258 Transcript_5613/m.11258 type:complete len:286 (+) Transcript_5613:3-860(+)
MVDIVSQVIDPNDLLVPRKCRCQSSGTPWLSVPLVGTAMVLVYNDPGCFTANLKLSKATMSGIYSGKIRNWNQVPGCSNVNLHITLCERCDNSMQTAALTRTLRCMGVQVPNEPCCAPGPNFFNFQRPAQGCSSVGGDLVGDCTRGGAPYATRVHGSVQQCVPTFSGSIAAFRYCDYLQATTGVKAFRLQTGTGRWVKPRRSEILTGILNSNCGKRCVPSEGWPMVVVPRMIYRARGYGSLVSVIRTSCRKVVRNRCSCFSNKCYFQLPRSCRDPSLRICKRISA